MRTVRVATFNVQNLAARYLFNGRVSRAALTQGWQRNDMRFVLHDEARRRNTAAAIRATAADVIALQEVENLATLRRFRDEHLGGTSTYQYMVLIEGNDPRGLDVALLSRLPITHLRSWQHLRTPGGEPVFSRDCLEADIALSRRHHVTLYVNHFKSMFDAAHRCDGRAHTRARRAAQARAVRQLIIERFGDQLHRKPFVILGDLNDYPQRDARGTSALNALLRWDAVIDTLRSLPAAARWTHDDPGDTRCAERPPSRRQLDYILISRALKLAAPPEIIRLSRARRGGGCASDHCPVAVTITL